ncbi:alpha-amylase family protein [uncultured Paraglaciecola sp.]|uniref:alpha-amylase family protein n=1 Tax=uncultured Paraglaciecola sp. TaxID=1765024 RepID=UPI0030DAF027|tara:strand:- start:75675 stop:77633 length:1959 start_codon:yes stop_codon:yes gene_type:complete
MFETKLAKWNHTILSIVIFAAATGCSPPPKEALSTSKSHAGHSVEHLLTAKPQGKPVVYQVFTRLFGNTNTNNTPWGTIEENGVGKFSDFTDTALQGIKELGTTHIWYTGVPHHDLITDYSAYGISHDDPDVVKGRAGSPYAVKDYYSVNPDLADDPAKRLQEFEALIARTHKNDMQVIIDIVPNHVARNYKSLAKPEGQSDFGEHDDTSVEYAKDNNFYYVVGQDFQVPLPLDGYQPLGGDEHPLADAKFIESPAKWTGNGSRKAQPHFHDWYETVKVNYGVKPDGSYDFPRLPEQYLQLGFEQHAQFWQDKVVPDSWRKFRDITHYWLDKGVDGFRYDMAEMVPVEFWSYLNSSIKMKNPQSFLLAEVYNPELYRQYIQFGKMDYLYDKVEFYDSLKAIMQGKEKGEVLHQIQSGHQDIERHMLHFLENHDEQRIASDDFAGKVGGAEMGMPALVVSALISKSPTLLYFGQEVGEDGSEDLGFGDPSRTSIFDYGAVPAHQRWMNNGKFDGGQLTGSEKALRNFYADVMKISAFHPAMLGEYMAVEIKADQVADIGTGEILSSPAKDKLVAFVRYTDKQQVLVISHFEQQRSIKLAVVLDNQQLETLGLKTDAYVAVDLLTGAEHRLIVEDQLGLLELTLAPMQSVVIQL